jgi:uncharacterized UPF0160 family protein
MSKKKYSAIIEMSFTSNRADQHVAQTHFREHMQAAFLCAPIEDSVFDSGGRLNPESERWDDHNYVYHLKLLVWSNRSLTKLFSVISIFRHWAELWQGEFSILEVRLSDS